MTNFTGYVHGCSGDTNAVRVTNHFLIGFKASQGLGTIMKSQQLWLPAPTAIKPVEDIPAQHGEGLGKPPPPAIKMASGKTESVCGLR